MLRKLATSSFNLKGSSKAFKATSFKNSLVKNTSFAFSSVTSTKSENELRVQEADEKEIAVGYDSQDGYIYDSLRDRTSGDVTGRNFNYLITGAAKASWAAAGRLAVIKFVSSMAASADVLALANLEVDLATIPVGQSITVKWRGKPVFIRHRTAQEIASAQADDSVSLRHQEKDADRTKNPDYLIVLGVCTHLGCVPAGNAGDFGGWFCPCHGSHYDISGRIRKGPAPLNLEVPPYTFVDSTKIIIG